MVSQRSLCTVCLLAALGGCAPSLISGQVPQDGGTASGPQAPWPSPWPDGGVAGGGWDGFTGPSDPGQLAATFPGSKLFMPPNAARPVGGVVMLHGSEGGSDGAIWEYAQALANDAGVVTLALCWFNCPTLPNKIFHIPLERVLDAGRWVKALPQVNHSKVALFGWSRGGEQSVLISSLLAATDLFAAVAVHAPSDTIVGAYDPATDNGLPETDPKTGMTVSGAAWTWQGQPLFGERDLNSYGTGPRIAVEKYPGPLFLSHSINDTLWSVQRSYNIAMARMAANLPTETHYWPGEDHVLMQPQDIAAFKAALAAFIKRNLAP
jgi:hypothetical protein